jgi:hypothetical protein
MGEGSGAGWSMELEELQMTADGSLAYRLGADDVSDFAAESWSANAEEPSRIMEWSAEPDLEDDDLELVPRDMLAELVRLAAIGELYTGCSTCRRVTEV